MKDPGLQQERTALAWNRTALLLTVNGGLALRTSWETGQPAYAVVASILLLTAAGASVYGAWRKRALLSATTPVAPSSLAVAAITAVTFVACVAGVSSAFIDS